MAEEMGWVRAFVAIEFPAWVKTAVSSLNQQLARTKGKIAWVKPEGVHLTLKFLGQISLQQLEQVKQALGNSATDVSPFNLEFTGLGVFPNERRPRVIWWGMISDPPQLNKLYQNLEEQLAGCDFPREKRPFAPHLTLGRVRKLDQPQQLIRLMEKAKIPTLPPVAVTGMDLMQSTLTGSGAIYNSVASFSFKG